MQENKEILAIAKEQNIDFKSGEVSFKGYEMLKNRALETAERIKSIEVNEDNIKVVKKELAAVNKDITTIDTVRKLIKKEILVSYTEFEEKVKEIITIVKDADNVIRTQVKELEEKEREAKKKEIENMFNDRIKHYKYKSLVSFESYFEPNMANKSTSKNNIEIAISEWLEQRESDIDLINTMEHRDDILLEYTKNGYRVSNAITTVNDRFKTVETIKKVSHEEMNVSKQYIFIIDNEKDAKLLELLMKENNIEYRKEVR